MKMLLFLFFSLILSEEVVVLSTGNFSDYVKDRNVLVEFYAPWCGHCKQLAPKYEIVATKINNDPSIDASIAKVDATAEKELAGRYGVSGYPTIKWFRKGSLEAEDYDSGRETDDIISWVSDAVTPVVAKIRKKEHEDFGQDSDYVLVSTVKADSKKEKHFDRACRRLRKETKKMKKSFQCGKTRLKKGKTKVAFRRNNFEEKDGPVELTFEGKMSKLDAWVLKNVFGQFGLFDSSGYLLERDDEELFLIVVKDKEYPSEIEGLGEFVNSMKLETGIQANRLDVKLADLWGLPTDEDVLYVYVKMKESGLKNDRRQPKDYKRYLLNPYTENTDLDTFLTKARAGEWKEHLKSQLPEDVKQEGLVVPLIANTFEEIVFDDTKDVLVEFYAPWCGHCKKFAPVYEKFAQTVNRYYKQKNLLVAMIDATANDVPVKIEGFPTLYMFPAEKNAEPIKFEGTRDIDDLSDFIEEYAHAVKPEKDEL